MYPHPLIGPTDLDFASSPEDALSTLTQLLVDDDAFARRLAMIDVLMKMPSPLANIIPADRAREIEAQFIPNLPTPHFVREICWISQGNLHELLQQNHVDCARLSKIVSHPEALRIAREGMLHGIENSTVQEFLMRHQSEVWNWLCDTVCSAPEEDASLPSDTYIAAWDTRKEVVVGGSSPFEAAHTVVDRWHVPMDIVAVTSRRHSFDDLVR